MRSGGGSRQQAEEEIAELEAELQAREQHLLDKKLRNHTFIRKVEPTDILITLHVCVGETSPILSTVQ